MFQLTGLGAMLARVVTLSPPTSEAGVRFPARPQVEKLVVACHWFAVQNPNKLYVLVSSALPTTRRDMTCVESNVKPQTNNSSYRIFHFVEHSTA